MKKANWLPVKGFEKYVVSYGGQVKNVRTGKRLKTFKNEKNYVCVMLTNNEGKSKKRKLHRIVAIAHIPNPDNLPEVNHDFGRKWDCRACVLSWIGRQANIDHAWQSGLCDHLKGKGTRKRKSKHNGKHKTKAKTRRSSKSDQQSVATVATP